jgi:hypothetical protein
VSPLIDLLTEQDRVRLNELITDIETHSEIGHVDGKSLKDIKLRANRVLAMVWMNEVESPFLYSGRFTQFGETGLWFIQNLRRPTVARFDSFRTRIENLTFQHPVVDKMLQVLSIMTPLIIMIESLSRLKVD